jgi:hypothetical protein
MIQFDAYLFVDWSATSGRNSAAPCADALWIGEGEWAADGSLAARESYWRSREECIGYVRAQLLDAASRGLCVLVGFDFPYGYSEGFARALNLDGPGPAWRSTWELIAGYVQELPGNRNNRFEAAAALNARCGAGPGPFWGCPTGPAPEGLAATSPGFPFHTSSGVTLDRLRRADRAAQRRKSSIQEGWKLYYRGSVGGQALTGIPHLLRLRDDPDLAPISRIWPLETGFTASPVPEHGPFILHAEIWPSLGTYFVQPGEIKDQVQVRTLVRWAAEQDACGALAAYFDQPAGLTAADLHACVDEEGWILGV